MKESVQSIEKKYQNAEFVKTELQKKGITIADTDEVKVTIKPYLSMVIKDIVAGEGEKQVKIEIEMLYDVEASVNGGGSVLLTEGVKLADSECKTMVITVELPNDIFSSEEVAAKGGIYVEHRKDNGTVYYHRATLTDGVDDAPDKITFTNDKGYSEFIIQLGNIPEPTVPGSGNNGNSSSGSNQGSGTPSQIIKVIPDAKATPSIKATPGTGDASNIWILIALMIAAAGVWAGTVYLKKKRNAQ
jgi:LPXTG-motif cell wall-anchored protein